MSTDNLAGIWFPFSVQRATFLNRPNRFRISAQLWDSGDIVAAHCPDPGRLRELLIPGVTVYVSKAEQVARKTAYDLRFVEHPENGQLISLDTRLPNQLVEHMLQRQEISAFRRYTSIRREVPLPGPSSTSVHSRIDFALTGEAGRRCWLEVKSVTLVENRRARFPDAPTARA